MCNPRLIFFGGVEGSRVPPFLHFVMGKMSQSRWARAYVCAWAFLLLRW